MTLAEVFDAFACLNLRALSLAIHKPKQLRRYISYSSKLYDELAGKGLPGRGPLTPSETETITLPAYHAGGGMTFGELVNLARVARTLKPKTIFEMGTYNGLATAVFVLNSDPDTLVTTLDLPPGPAADQVTLSADRDLIAERDLASVPRALGLQRYAQLLCDSMAFDPSPYADSVDLGLVDAAHDLAHVENDTIKMAKMMSVNGLVFWHDYGGKGAFGPLASYLETLAKQCPLYRIPETSLAWTHARDLKPVLL